MAGGPAFRQHNHESGCPILARSLRKGGWPGATLNAHFAMNGAIAVEGHFSKSARNGAPQFMSVEC